MPWLHRVSLKGSTKHPNKPPHMSPVKRLNTHIRRGWSLLPSTGNPEGFTSRLKNTEEHTWTLKTSRDLLQRFCDVSLSVQGLQSEIIVACYTREAEFRIRYPRFCSLQMKNTNSIPVQQVGTELYPSTCLFTNQSWLTGCSVSSCLDYLNKKRSLASKSHYILHILKELDGILLILVLSYFREYLCFSKVCRTQWPAASYLLNYFQPFLIHIPKYSNAFVFLYVFLGLFTSYSLWSSSLAGWKKSGKLTGFPWIQIIWNRVLCTELFFLFVLTIFLEFELQFKTCDVPAIFEWQKNSHTHYRRQKPCRQHWGRELFN